MTPSSTDAKRVRSAFMCGTATLDVVAGELERALGRSVLGVEPLGVLQPLDVEALEPGVDVVVVRAAPARAEAHRQEQLVDPVLDVLAHEVVDELAGDEELVARVLVLDRSADDALREVDARSARRRQSSRTGWLMPAQIMSACSSSGSHHAWSSGSRSTRGPRQRGPLGRDDRPLARLVGLEVGALVRRRSSAGSTGCVDVEAARRHVGDRARQHQAAAGAAVLRDVVEERGLVGERVPLVAVRGR